MSGDNPSANDLLAMFDSLDDVLGPVTGNLEEFAPPELVAASRPSEIPRPVAEASPVIRYTPGPTLDDRRRSYPDAVPPSMSAGGRVRGSTSDVLARFAFGGDR